MPVGGSGVGCGAGVRGARAAAAWWFASVRERESELWLALCWAIR